MDFFDFIGNALRDTFIYFKSRTKKKYEGDRFEEWVVTHSRIKKYWKLLDWRGDKIVGKYYPESNRHPDLLLQHYRSENKKCYRIAVECKYRESEQDIEEILKNKKKDYIKFVYTYNNEHKEDYQISNLYAVVGFGWSDLLECPKKVIVQSLLDEINEEKWINMQSIEYLTYKKGTRFIYDFSSTEEDEPNENPFL